MLWVDDTFSITPAALVIRQEPVFALRQLSTSFHTGASSGICTVFGPVGFKVPIGCHIIHGKITVKYVQTYEKPVFSVVFEDNSRRVPCTCLWPAALLA